MARTLSILLVAILAAFSWGCDRRTPASNEPADVVKPVDSAANTIAVDPAPQPIGGGSAGPPGCPEPGRCYHIGCDFSAGLAGGDQSMLAHYRAAHPGSCTCGFSGDGTRAAFDRHLREQHAAHAEAVLGAAPKRADPTAAEVAVIRLVRVGWQGAVVVRRDGSVQATVPGRSQSTATVLENRSGRIDPAKVFDEVRLRAVLAAPEGGSADAKEWLCLEAADGWVLRQLRGGADAGAVGELWEGLYAAATAVGLAR